MEYFPCTEHTVLKNGHVIKKIKGLKYHSYLGAIFIDLFLDCSDLFSMIPDLSAGLGLQLIDTAKQSGFSGTGGTNDTDDLPGSHIKIDLSQYFMFSKGFA